MAGKRNTFLLMLMVAMCSCGGRYEHLDVICAASLQMDQTPRRWAQGLGESFADLGGCERPTNCGSVRCVLSSWGADNALKEIIPRSLRGKTSLVKTAAKMEYAALKDFILVAAAVPITETHVISWPRVFASSFLSFT
ncbi:uncharacterized protein ACIQIH_004544 isoform 1-T1 [Cyanocitta cristata]